MLARAMQGPRPQRMKGAEPQLLSASGPVVQRKVTIGKQALPRYGKQARELWNEIRLDLFDANISPHGLKHRYFDQILTSPNGTYKKPVYAFDTTDDFREYFVADIEKRLGQEEKRAAVERAIKRKNKSFELTKRTVRPFMLRRPAWPKGYREMLGATAGEDLRHVVRNATIKRALESELQVLRKQLSVEQLDEYYANFAKAIKIEPKQHHLETLSEIYKHLYLNARNLFPGPGAVNQMIGFTADPIIKFGMELKKEGEKLVSIDSVADQLSAIVEARVRQIRKKGTKLKAGKTRFLEGHGGYFDNVKDYIAQLHQLWHDEYGEEDEKDPTSVVAPSGKLAERTTELGDNLGFDSLPGDDVASRQAPLLEFETAVQSGKLVPGTLALAEKARVFLGLEAKESKATGSFRDVKDTATMDAEGVELTQRHLKQHVTKGQRVSKTAAVYLNAVRDYITAEILEAAGNKAKEAGRSRIDQSQVIAAVTEDDDLAALVAPSKVTEEDLSGEEE